MNSEQRAEDLLNTLAIDRVLRIPLGNGSHYARKRLYDAAQRLRFRISVLTDKQTNEMLLLRTR